MYAYKCWKARMSDGPASGMKKPTMTHRFITYMYMYKNSL